MSENENKRIAWVSIIIITIIAGYYLLNRQPIQLQEFLTYTEPGAYPISYLFGWLREEQGRTEGRDILSFNSHDYRKPKIARWVNLTPAKLKSPWESWQKVPKLSGGFRNHFKNSRNPMPMSIVKIKDLILNLIFPKIIALLKEIIALWRIF